MARAQHTLYALRQQRARRHKGWNRNTQRAAPKYSSGASGAALQAMRARYKMLRGASSVAAARLAYTSAYKMRAMRSEEAGESASRAQHQQSAPPYARARAATLRATPRAQHSMNTKGVAYIRYTAAQQRLYAEVRGSIYATYMNVAGERGIW